MGFDFINAPLDDKVQWHVLAKLLWQRGVTMLVRLQKLVGERTQPIVKRRRYSDQLPFRFVAVVALHVPVIESIPRSYATRIVNQDARTFGQSKTRETIQTVFTCLVQIERSKNNRACDGDDPSLAFYGPINANQGMPKRPSIKHQTVRHCP